LTKPFNFFYLIFKLETRPFLPQGYFMKEIDKERQMIRETALKTAQKTIQPRAAEIDEVGEYPADLMEAIGRQGFLCILLPEEYGGMNGDITTFCLLIEEIAKVSGSSSLLLLAQGLGTLPVWLGGSDAQKERYFTQISEKNSLIAFTLNEGETGLEAPSIKARAQQKGKEYLLSGRKCFITHGSIADLYAVFALTEPEKGAEGISAFVVEKGTPGLLFGQKEEKLGMRGAVTTDVIFESCRIPGENRLGEEGQGWKIAMDTLTMARPAMGAQAVGIAQGALDFAIRYANERIQFKKPISSFQAIQFMIADMATHIEAARALVYQAAACVNTGLEGAERLSTMAKLYASDVAMKVTTDAVQILGGYGYMKDYPVERMMRDAKVTQILEGSNQLQRFIVAQHLFRD
jgi:alkylation response protein AidB-like acyl-CoA dehydrogenase